MLLKFQTLFPSIVEVLYLVESENHVLVSAIFVTRLSYGVLLSLLGERERAHLVVQPARNSYVRTCDWVTLTVISILPSRVMSRACAQSLCHVCAPDFVSFFCTVSFAS